MTVSFRAAVWLAAPVIAACLAALPAPARAQSFECERASTRIERMICSDRELGGLDDALSGAYSLAVETAADPSALIRAQRAWLRRRDACGDRACVAAAYRDREPVVRATPRAGRAVHRDAELGLSFEYLANREVRHCPEGYDPCVAIYGRAGGQTDRLLMAFQTFDGPLEAVARSNAGFEQRDGGWFTTYGRFEPQRVEAFEAGGLKGLQATITCGISDENGFHAAAGECYWGVLSDGRRSVVMTTEGRFGLDAETRRSVDTLQFLQP